MEDGKAYANVIKNFPPEKHEPDDTVLLKLLRDKGWYVETRAVRADRKRLAGRARAE